MVVDGVEDKGAVVPSDGFPEVLVGDAASVDEASELVEVTAIVVVSAADDNVVVGGLMVVDVVGVVIDVRPVVTGVWFADVV